WINARHDRVAGASAQAAADLARRALRGRELQVGSVARRLDVPPNGDTAQRKLSTMPIKLLRRSPTIPSGCVDDELPQVFDDRPSHLTGCIKTSIGRHHP